MITQATLASIASITQGLTTSGRGAGARSGDWRVACVSVGDIQDDSLLLENADMIEIEQNIKTEKHLLRPDDLLVSARSTLVKAALVPPSASRLVADATLLVIRGHESALGPYLWWYFTSSHGRASLQSRATGSTVWSLSVAALGQLELPVPSVRELYRIAKLVEVSERSYQAALGAARSRREVVREAVLKQIAIHGI